MSPSADKENRKTTTRACKRYGLESLKPRIRTVETTRPHSGRRCSPTRRFYESKGG
jgi:hypothetical protein